MFVSEIKDIIVYSKDMVNVGKVKDLEFDTSEMKVTDIIVEFQKEAAKRLLGKRVVIRHATGRVPTSSIESIKDALHLKLPWTELKDKFETL
ncbi:MAG: PRC-barrel domain-containing protein [Candidatus Bathyarchaeia archaeon]